MYSLNKNNQLCVKAIGAGRPSIVNIPELLINWMDQKKLNYEEAKNELEALIESLKEPPPPEPIKEDSVELLLVDVISRYNPLKGFKVFSSTKKVIVWEQDNKTVMVGTFDNLTAKVIDNILAEHDPIPYAQFCREMAKIIHPKNYLRVSDVEVLDYTLNHLKPKQTLPRVEMDTDDIQPSLLEGIETPSLHKIPYKHMDVVFSDLNPYLQDILLRINNHKHLCAVIYGQFTGKQWPYICYLYGKEGREGKTQFINMVGRLSKSFANLTDDSRFSLFSLYGKSIILVPENDKSRLMSSKTIKAITGGSILQIEEKGKTGFSGNILGTIMVDANFPLRISGRNFETDRLRYFTVAPHNKTNDQRLGPTQYFKELSSTPNEFLNYCRICCEELMTDGGLLKEPDDHQDVMKSLTDTEQEFEYNLVLDKVLKTLKMGFVPEMEIEQNNFLHAIKNAFSNKKDFFSTSFLHFLEKRGVTSEKGKLKGIGPVSDGHTTFRRPE